MLLANYGLKIETMPMFEEDGEFTLTSSESVMSWSWNDETKRGVNAVPDTSGLS